MRWSGAGAGLIVMAVFFVIIAIAVVLLFRAQPGVQEPPEACNPSVPFLTGGPGLDLPDLSLEANDSAVVALRANSRRATLHAITLSWEHGVDWTWTGERVIPRGDVTGIRVEGRALPSRSCATGNLSITYTLTGHGLLNVTGQGIEQRVP